ncbi:transposable element Tcb2 transposase [Trichonephila clavipes]|nr:transposable element Tcb2 transposase [Trichonephila clavipes]
MQDWKSWTDERRTTGNGRWKATSARDNRHLLRMMVNDRTAPPRSWQLVGLLLQMTPLTANHQRLRLQWAHERRAWPADWHQIVFSDESRFNLQDHDGRIRVRRSAGERCLPDKRYVGEVLQPVVPFLQHTPGAIYQQDKACPYVAKTAQDFCSAQRMQLLPWPPYSLNMSPIKHVWDLVGWRLARDLRSADSKDEFFLHIQAIWNSLPQADIQNLFDSMPRRITARGGYTKY